MKGLGKAVCLVLSSILIFTSVDFYSFAKDGKLQNYEDQTDQSFYEKTLSKEEQDEESDAEEQNEIEENSQATKDSKSDEDKASENLSSNENKTSEVLESDEAETTGNLSLEESKTLEASSEDISIITNEPQNEGIEETEEDTVLIINKDGDEETATDEAYFAWTEDSAVTGNPTTMITGLSEAGKAAAITKLIIPAKCTSIGENAFKGNTTIEEISFEDDSECTTINGGAFESCEKLTSVVLPRTLTTVNPGKATIDGVEEEVGPFYNCESLESIYLSEYGSVVPDYIFSYMDEKVEYQLPLDYEKVGYKAFYNSKLITNYTAPEKLETIDEQAFDGACCLESVDLSSVSYMSSIGERAFNNCTLLKTFKFPKTILGSGIDLNVGLYVEADEETKGIFYNCPNLESIYFHTDSTSIPSYALYGAGSVDSISYGSNIEGIGDMAFYGCTSLETFQIPDSVTDIGDSAFKNCTSLSQIKIPASVKRIGPTAFKGASGVTDLDLGDCLEIGIARNAFADCTSLKTIELPISMTSSSCMDFDGEMDIPGMFEGCTGIETVTVSESMEKLPGGIFKDCQGPKNVVLGKNLKEIEANAFRDCTNIISVNFSKCTDLESIGGAAFKNCTGLTKLEVPATVKTLESACFSGCTNLKDIYFGNNITSVAKYDSSNEGIAKDCNAMFYVKQNSTSYTTFMNNGYASRLNIGARTYNLKLNYMDGNGAVDSALTYTVGGKLSGSLPKDSPIENYNLTGWYLNSSYSGSAVTANTKISVENATLYAKYTPISLTVTFNSNIEGATGTMKNQALYYDVATNLTANAFKKTGYVFTGWNTSTDGSGTAYDNKATVTLKESTTLYAQWKNTFSIVYNVNGGTIEAGATMDETDSEKYNSTYTYGTKPSFATPVKKGYIFSCWCTDSALKNKVSVSKTTAKDLELYAKWTPVKYTIVFDKNTPSGLSKYTKVAGSTKSLKKTYGTNASLSTNGYSLAGYKFLGWAAEKNKNTAIADFADATTLTTDLSYTNNATVKLYAIWKSVTKNYMVEYDLNTESFTSDGITPSESKEAPSAQVFTYGKVSTLAKYTGKDINNKYVFMGWSTSKKGSVIYANGAKITTPSEISDTNKNLMLYGVWRRNFSISYHTNGGTMATADVTSTGEENQTYSKNYTYKTTVKLAKPTKAGYTFGGWYSDNGTFKKKVTSVGFSNINTDVYAKWTPITYTITYNKNAPVVGKKAVSTSGTMASKKINYETDYVLAANAYSAAGYKFVGWALTKNATEATISDQQTINLETTEGLYEAVNGKTITLYAVWTSTSTYEIKYVLNGGKMSSADISEYALIGDDENIQTFTYTTSEVIYVPTPVRTGYTFCGWYYDSSFKKAATKTDKNGTYFVKGTYGDKVVYAKWKF